jgi:NAD(P)-dependent dehydrogenase (short-subunit alcohol dehydrogenase family)
MQTSTPPRPVFRNNLLAGKRILVTGGGSGIGRALAHALAAYEADVFICSRRLGVLREAADSIEAATGRKVTLAHCDIRDPASIDLMLSGIWSDGPLNGLVNNAAANFLAPTHTISTRGYDAVRSTVMDGTFYTTLAIGKRWIDEQIRGSIVSNLVTWIWTGSPFVVPSAMAKTAIHAMTMSLAVEWASRGIRLNAVAPGPFPTEGAWEKLNPIPDTRSSVTDADSVPFGRFGQMYELQNLVVFLLSDACDYLTGQTIAIDGGQHLAGPATFADLGRLTPDQWAQAREAIRATSDRDKAQRSDVV